MRRRAHPAPVPLFVSGRPPRPHHQGRCSVLEPAPALVEHIQEQVAIIGNGSAPKSDRRFGDLLRIGDRPLVGPHVFATGGHDLVRNAAGDEQASIQFADHHGRVHQRVEIFGDEGSTRSPRAIGRHPPRQRDGDVGPRARRFDDQSNRRVEMVDIGHERCCGHDDRVIRIDEIGSNRPAPSVHAITNHDVSRVFGLDPEAILGHLPHRQTAAVRGRG